MSNARLSGSFALPVLDTHHVDYMNPRRHRRQATHFRPISAFHASEGSFLVDPPFL